jgi:hypothetical protein
MRQRLQITNKPLSGTGQTAHRGSTNLYRRSDRSDCRSTPELFMDRRMPRVTCRSWTVEQITLLLALVDRGVSPARASVVLKRPRLAVQNKARELGKPFADSRLVRAMRLAREAQPRKAVEQSAQSSSGLSLPQPSRPRPSFRSASS